MKCKIPEISWHNRDPVLSVDIQPQSGTGSSPYRLASGGTDSHVLIWYITLVGDDMELDLAADLSRHQRAVNAVRWSPNGELLASGDDESVIFIWKQKAETEVLNIMDTANDHDKEVWLTLKVLRGHMEDVYDLCWSPNSLFLISGSVDNSAMVWDVQKGKSMATLTDHKGFVQGVAWDPLNQYLATLCTDRYLRIIDIQSKRVLYRVNKSTLPVPEGHALHGRRMPLFHDDTLQTFYRRLSFSPDGLLILTPAGFIDHDNDEARPQHATYIFSRYSLRQPAIVLPCPDQYTVAVRFCPLLFRLRPHDPATNAPVVPLPYRMIFAVATRSSIYFYDTQQLQPFAVISNIHYTRLTDVTWASDGRLVVVSSTDGFCSLIKFEADELGEEFLDAQGVLDAVRGHSESVTTVRKSKKQKETDSATKSRRKSTPIVKETPIEALLAKASTSTQKTAEKSKMAKENSPPREQKDGNAGTGGVAAASSSGQQQTTDSKQTSIASTFSLAIGNKAVILDKEILSSEEKFESPEKKCRPVTPISVRRHPRITSPALSGSAAQKTTALPQVSGTGAADSLTKLVISPRPTNRATPIAVRRKPRALIAVLPVAETPSVVAEDEAMDAWPLLPDSPPTNISSSTNNQTKTEEAKVEAPTQQRQILNDASMNCTDDIRLVYEDTADGTTDQTEKVAEAIEEKAPQVDVVPAAAATPEIVQSNIKPDLPKTPPQKKPRRVALTTISTPKSKKKPI